MFWQQLINGLTVGSTYSLIAIGYTLIFGVLGMINMAHGQIFIFGAITALLTMTYLGWPLWLAFVVSVFVSSVLGWILELTAFKPLRKKDVPHLAPLISTIGFATILDDLMIKVFGADSRAFPTEPFGGSVTFGPIQIRVVDGVILGVALVLMMLLHLWIERTKLGKAIRATSENIDTAEILGIPTNRVIVITVIIASGLGGIAGILLGLAYGALSPSMGLTLGFKGLAVLVLGGLGNVPGAMLGGLILGVVEVLSVAYGQSTYRDAIAFLMIMIIFFIRPQGLFGSQERA
ncbi:MAG: branched-chain amino acid ABC transporter permease [Candidatus Carbobacillus sp.]|nr:branched-chain amino acid ABC transporter permease [Candidatus Carbobacillus sp.]